MAHNDYKEGWGVVDDDGLDVRTVSDTRRAAIINWLITKAGVVIYNFTPDDQINALWDVHCGEAVARPVRLYVQ